VISHEHKAIFVHQRKCAGSSICIAFGIQWAFDNINWHYLNGGVNTRENDAYPDFFRFSVVRNPYDRFISGWRYCEFTRDLPIVEVLRNMPAPDPLTDNPNDPEGRAGFGYIHITRPQHEILFRADGTMGVDFVMRFENLQEDFDRVCKIIGKPRCGLPLTNFTLRKKYQHYFDDSPEARQLLEKHFERDFELFGYHY
jgi:hypothetical protein